ncbi:class I SAM-dependent methyltransferase [Actinomycetospora sp. CA-101289]|uniref:class I SAM-dependent methyltransferase n=1 Tax=Actinomycetospora sp. CA-101289 TaxID=3239893 RepID=UPI003D95C3AC
MNRLETLAINSPPRRWLQRTEARWLRKLGGTLEGARALEIGAGSGHGTRLILDVFGAQHVDAVDLDPAMVARARRTLADRGPAVRVEEGSATDLRAALGEDAAGDASYDAVFDFAIIHHVPDWRDAVGEVARVLRPGGRFFFDEVTAAALDTRVYRRLFDHPREDRFTADQFEDELARAGLDVAGRSRTVLRGHYVLGVATRLG